MDENNITMEPEIEEKSDAELKEAITQQFEKIRTQNLLLGAQVSCSVILQKIAAFRNKPGKLTLNDHRRLVADIEKFCKTSMSRQVNSDGTTTEVNENDTKLMEETNESISK